MCNCVKKSECRIVYIVIIVVCLMSVVTVLSLPQLDNVTIDLSYLSCADEPEPSSTSSPTVNPTSTPTVQSTGRLSYSLLCIAIIL